MLKFFDVKLFLKQILVFSLFLLLYVTFRSVQLDLTEAIALDFEALYSPNHMLNRPIANVVWKMFQAAGYTGRSVYVLQILNVVYGAIAVAIAFAAYQKLGASSWAALCACILLGTSFTHWSQSTDAYYIVLSGMFAAAALLCSAILIEKSSLLTAFFLGVCFACTTLSWQATVLLFPILMWPMRRRFKELTMFVVTSIIILMSFYLFAGISNGKTTVKAMFLWATSHDGGNIPWWGQLDIHRIPLAAITAIQSIQAYAPLWTKGFFLYSSNFVSWGIGVGAVCFVFLGIAILTRGIQLRNSKLIWLLSGYLVIFAFLVWWEPMDLKNFFVPNIFVCAIAAVVFSSWKPIPITKILVVCAVTVMAFVTFSFSIWPRHIDRGINMRKAECIQQNVASKDKIISTDWSCTAELYYFYQIDTFEIVSLGAGFRDHDKLINYLDNELPKIQSNGGKIFIPDPSSYAEEYLKWLGEQTTFTSADFDRFPGRFAFQCEDIKFLEVTSLAK